MLDHLAHPEDVRRHVDTVLRALADVRQGTQVYVPSVDAHARVAEILDAIADGATPRHVCRRFGISRRTYYRYRSRLVEQRRELPPSHNAALCGPSKE
jgi:FixJ family two-component response regulator